MGGTKSDRPFLDYHGHSGFGRAFESEDTLMVSAAMNIKVVSSSHSMEPSVLVMGMGVTGASCARFLATQGIGAEFVDTRPEPPQTNAILDAMPDARIHSGGQLDTLRPSIRRIVVSPGVDLTSPLISEGRRRGVDVVSDIDLFVGECTAPIITVTGSNGKSTVTSMLGDMLSTAGWYPAIGGNLGTPALDLLAPDKDVYVLELSSFQLERSALIPAAAAVILNVSPDHLDLHGDMQSYTAAKARIYSECRHAVVNRDREELQGLVPVSTPVTSYGLGQPAVGELGIQTTSRGECLAFGDTLLLSADELPVLGRHNLSNALAALALGSALGANLHSMAQALKAYEGLPHRMQTVADLNGILWIDDSKATNAGAAAMSVASVSDPLVLIAGGDAKGASFEALVEALTDRQCTAVLLGKDSAALAIALNEVCDVRIVTDMHAAVTTATEIAVPGYTVLLAPACSSLDMYDSFEQRGDTFVAAVQELAR
jgi:UDP-N-acetylmuramoylalanine--D-glutamate ligase